MITPFNKEWLRGLWSECTEEAGETYGGEGRGELGIDEGTRKMNDGEEEKGIADVRDGFAWL